MTSPSYYIDLENRFGAHNYHPLPVVLSKGHGVHVWDVQGKQYIDSLSAYSAVNQGHSHPKITEALCSQAQVLTLTSRAFYNDKLGPFEKYLCSLLGYDKVLMMNSGAEANETALKLARKWGYTVKGIPENQAIIVAVNRNFHGRTTGIISASTNPTSRKHFGPFMPGYHIIEYDDVQALDQALSHPHVCGFWVEPIQGEAGVYVPQSGYLAKAQELCKKNNVLLMMDEIQTGLGRTGSMLASDHEGVHPDVLILGKALSGGTMPISAVLADDPIMLCIQPGEHGSTFGGNPLACVVAQAALEVIVDEKLAQNASTRGEEVRAGLLALKSKFPHAIASVRGKGLLNALIIHKEYTKFDAWTLCMQFAHNGLLAKATHGNIIRLSPPLIITADQVRSSLSIIEQSLIDLQAD